MINKSLISSNEQKVLSFLLLNHNKSCYEREIARGSKISYGSANKILNELYKKGVVERKTEGRMNHYTVNLSNPYIQEFKILTNMLLLEPMIEKLKQHTHKIVLFGSFAKGEDTQGSDIDLFIITSKKDVVRSIINKLSRSAKVVHRKIQAIIESPADLIKKGDSEKIFMEQVNQGKILWERNIEDDNF